MPCRPPRLNLPQIFEHSIAERASSSHVPLTTIVPFMQILGCQRLKVHSRSAPRNTTCGPFADRCLLLDPSIPPSIARWAFVSADFCAFLRPSPTRFAGPMVTNEMPTRPRPDFQRNGQRAPVYSCRCLIIPLCLGFAGREISDVASSCGASPSASDPAFVTSTPNCRCLPAKVFRMGISVMINSGRAPVPEHSAFKLPTTPQNDRRCRKGIIQL